MTPVPETTPIPEEYRIRLTNTPHWYYCEPWWRWEPSALSDYDLWCVRSGTGKLESQSASWDVTPNTCFVMKPGFSAVGTQDPENRLVLFAVHFEWLDGMNQVAGEAPFSFPEGPLPVHDWGKLEIMSMEAQRTYARHDALGRVQATAWVRQILLLLMAELTLPPPTLADKTIEEIIARCRQFPAQCPGVKEMAAMAHLSPSQFTRRFRAITGLAPRHFTIRTRLDRARQLLEETDMTQDHIARALGYNNLFFFSKQYKELIGETPSTTRRKARKR